MSGDQQQYIQFAMEKEKYAVHIAEVHEIIRVQEITEIPNVKPYVKGVINLRGHVIPVISLRQFMGMDQDVFTRTTRIIVLNHKEDTVGIIVDQVNKVATYSEIQPPPERLGQVVGRYFSGIGLSSEGLIGILHLEEVLLKEDDHLAAG